MTVDRRLFRDAVGRFATGVTVITGLWPNGRPAGVTASAFTSVSLAPPLVLVCVAKTTTCLAAFTEGRHFAVNLLGADQKHISLVFASRRQDKFTGVEYSTWESGCPILPGCIATLECARTVVHEGGDHVVILGQVERIALAEDAEPLLHFRGAYARIGGSL